MQAETAKKLFTVDELYKMDEAGLFRDQHVELIHGEVFLMAKGNRHQARVDRVSDVFKDAFARKVIVRVQGPLFVDEYNLPEPDVLLVQRRDDYYESGHPTPKDVFLVLEIADSSITHDLETKLALYAIAGVKEYWIEDIRQNRIMVFREPANDAFQIQQTFHRGESISTLAFPDTALKVDDLLG